MNASESARTSGLVPGDQTAGFDILGVEALDDLGCVAVRARHRGTGADVLHLATDDRENIFSVNLRTPVGNSTGVAHILEHCVLAGSTKFPVRDAFNELSRASFRTYLNAFTGSDYTCYPVASTLDVDFYNLADVYFDLVFHPLLSRQTFMQEGHHLEIVDDRLRVSGVVFNEMKGAFASADRVLTSLTMRHLCPDSPYGVDSGGHPDEIPDLDYDTFVAFHRRCYAPSRAKFYFYGSLPTARHLEFLGPRLDATGPATPGETTVDAQPRWSSPRDASGTFAVADDDPSTSGYLQLAWLTCDANDLEQIWALDILAACVLGTSGSPLRRAVVESTIGSDLSPLVGASTTLRDSFFWVGLRGADVTRMDEFTDLVIGELSRLRDDGFERSVVEGALHQLHVARREILRARRPHGLRLMLTALPTWTHDGDPLARLRPAPFATAADRALNEPSSLRDAIDRHLLCNPHRLSLVLAPKPGQSTLDEASRAARLDARFERMTEDDRLRIEKDATDLRRFQRSKDAPEATASLPRLDLSDLPRTTAELDTRDDGVWFEHDIDTNGMVYVDLGFDLGELDAGDHDDVSLLALAMSGSGTRGETYAEFANRKASCTRGVSVSARARRRVDGRPATSLVVRTGALVENVDEMIDVVRALVLDVDFTDTDRLRTLIESRRQSLRSALMPGGYTYTRLAAAAALTVPGSLRESWEGVTHLRRLAVEVAELGDGSSVAARLGRLRDRVVSAATGWAHVSGSAHARARVRARLGDLVQRRADASDVAWGEPRTDRRVGIPWSSPVTHTARVFDVPPSWHDDGPALAVAATALRGRVLYPAIRVEGGAYGAVATYDGINGQFALMSYRDPNLDETFAVFDRAADSFASSGFDDEALRKAVISTVASFDAPSDPRGEAHQAVERALIGVTPEMRASYRSGMLSVGVGDVNRVVAKWLAEPARVSESALASPERLASATPPFSAAPLDANSGSDGVDADGGR